LLFDEEGNSRDGDVPCLRNVHDGVASSAGGMVSTGGE
jgi:hypothetical protein